MKFTYCFTRFLQDIISSWRATSHWCKNKTFRLIFLTIRSSIKFTRQNYQKLLPIQPYYYEITNITDFIPLISTRSFYLDKLSRIENPLFSPDKARWLYAMLRFKELLVLRLYFVGNVHMFRFNTCQRWKSTGVKLGDRGSQRQSKWLPMMQLLWLLLSYLSYLLNFCSTVLRFIFLSYFCPFLKQFCYQPIWLCQKTWILTRPGV